MHSANIKKINANEGSALFNPLCYMQKVILLKYRWLALTAIMACFALPASAQKEDYSIPKNAIYHYFDKDGNRQMGRYVPPENVRYGYRVVDGFGREIMRVDRALTEEEQSSLKEQRAAERLAKEKRQRDQMLLRTFSTAEDATRARDRKLAALDVIVDITRGNILQLQSEYEEHQSTAVKQERAGRAVPEEIVQRLEELKDQITEAFQFVKLKENEKAAVRQDYDEDIQRLKELRRRPSVKSHVVSVE